MTIDEIKKLNSSTGDCFFSPSTIYFFKSRILPTVYGDKYFITSERYNRDSPCKYTIRKLCKDSSIATIGEFQQYKSRIAAIAGVKRIVKGISIDIVRTGKA